MQPIDDLVFRTRSCRRFRERKRVDRQMLVDLVNLAREAGSAGNRQPLRYMIFRSEEDCARIFPHLKWAGLLTDWFGPAEGERPAAYILVLNKKADGGMPQCDAGIAMQTLLLGAVARGLAGCMLGSIDRSRLIPVCNVPDGMELLYVIALGYAAETVVLEEAVDGNINYYRDANEIHHVPKRPLREVLLSGEKWKNASDL